MLKFSLELVTIDVSECKKRRKNKTSLAAVHFRMNCCLMFIERNELLHPLLNLVVVAAAVVFVGNDDVN